MKFEMTKEEYLVFKEFIDINKLDIEIVSVIMDEQLYNLGFAKTVPCIVEVNATEKAIEDAVEIAYWLEVNAFNTPGCNEPSENDAAYLLYKQYGWIWDLFNSDNWEYKE